MSIKLEVLLDEAEHAQLCRLAQRKGLTVADWIRDSIRTAARQQPTKTKEKKLAAIRSASRHGAPIADIDQMLAEIERGYSSE